MEVYYYCSYTGSPVGFQLGKLDSASGKLSGENIPPLLRRCFSRGMIRKACGCLPGEGKYFVLVKDLAAKKSTAGDAEEYYLNIALVSDQVEDYRKWLTCKNIPEQTIADLIRDTMSLHGDPTFGFTVRADKINHLSGIALGDSFRGIQAKEDDSYFQVLSPNLRSEEVQDALNLPNDGYALEKLRTDTSRDGNWFHFFKKKEKQSPRWKVILIPAAVLIVLAGLFMLLKFLKK